MTSREDTGDTVSLPADNSDSFKGWGLPQPFFWSSDLYRHCIPLKSHNPSHTAGMVVTITAAVNSSQVQ